MLAMEREFRPELISRQGERNAWGLAIVTIVVWLVFRARIPTFGTAILVFAILLTLSAALISLSNWVDRKSTLILNADSVTFRSPLRDVSLSWDQIQKVRVIADRLGERVHVSGTESRFNFRTLSIVEHKGEVRGQMGFTQGEEILNQILKSAGLHEIPENDNGHYYARP